MKEFGASTKNNVPHPNMLNRLSSLEENAFQSTEYSVNYSLQRVRHIRNRTEYEGAHSEHCGTRPVRCPGSSDKNKQPSKFPQSLMLLTEIRSVFSGWNICREFDFQLSLHANSG
jgi:hypothetical protein